MFLWQTIMLNIGFQQENGIVLHMCQSLVLGIFVKGTILIILSEIQTFVRSY